MRDGDVRRYGGFWRRFAATLIDGLIFSILTMLLLYLLYGPVYFQRQVVGIEDYTRSTTMPELVISWIVPLLITVFCWVRFRGTPGKLLLGCQVVDARSGASLRPGQALLRYLAYAVSLLPLGLGFLWIMWDKHKQGFHDKIAGTVVLLEDESRKSLAELERELH